ncbi:NTP transferase domain-containing protein [Nocardioides panacisoli]|uniref:molybdenum cofactor guanylyltransferase n=1 Tax=Nocardioides panacisoli TaxID=627624 RepID=UPI001C62C315|nr:NTP transferase domain-containing protein [Nocardioides panacisoli]QYJ03499.1 NTP transferase domain-containing protein [Nocardioides panacisoli]
MSLDSFAAIVLAGGRGSRLGGADKASIEVDGRTLLAHALEAVVDAAEVVVVGTQVPTDRPVTFVREDPAYGGPVAGLLTGRDALFGSFATVAVLAVDMPRVTTTTIRRLRDAAEGRDGAALTDPGGHRQLALVLRTAGLDAARPPLEEQHGASLHSLLAPLDLAAVPAHDREHRDVDSWTDLRDLADPGPE